MLATQRTSVTLTDVVGVADALFHAIPTAEEVARAVNRLANAGYIRVDGLTFSANEQTSRAYADASTQSAGEGAMALVGRLQALLPPQSSETRWQVSEQQMLECYSEYMGRMGWKPTSG